MGIGRPSGAGMRRLPGPAAALAVGALLFLWRFDPAIVAPRHVDWLLVGGDPSMVEMGWEYFRQDPWAWPPGAGSSYGAPLGSSIGLSDGIPLLALPGKLLGGGRTAPWQYFGLWILACHLLQALASWLLAGAAFPRFAARLPAAALLLLMPSWLQRVAHIALSGHWLVLLALLACLRGAPVRAWMLLVTVAAFVHPYLGAMVLGLAAAGLAMATRQDQALAPGRAAAAFAGLAATLLAGWWLSGMTELGVGSANHAEGFTQFSANLNTLVNPLAYGRLLPAQPLLRDTQVEGFNYLGVGLLPLWLLGAGMIAADGAARRALWRRWPLVLVLAAMALYALSFEVGLGRHRVFFARVPGLLEPLTGAFRAPGRFLWPVTYAATLAGLWSLGRVLKPRWQAPVLAALVVVQVVDLQPLLRPRAHFQLDRPPSRLVDPAWAGVMAGTTRLLTLPPFQVHTQFPYDFHDLDLPLVFRGVPTSAIYLTRTNEARAEAWKASFRAALAAGQKPGPGTTIVVRSDELTDWAGLLAPDFTGYDLDGFRVFVHRTRPVPGAQECLPPEPVTIGSFLEANRGRTLALAACDDAVDKLPGDARAELARRGLAVERLQFRYAFAAVLGPEGVLWQEIADDHPVGGQVDGPRRLALQSSGYGQGDVVSLRLDGVEHALGGRGLHLLALDERWRPVAVARFDTFLGPDGWQVRYGDTGR